MKIIRCNRVRGKGICIIAQMPTDFIECNNEAVDPKQAPYESFEDMTPVRLWFWRLRNYYVIRKHEEGG